MGKNDDFLKDVFVDVQKLKERIKVKNEINNSTQQKDEEYLFQKFEKYFFKFLKETLRLKENKVCLALEQNLDYIIYKDIVLRKKFKMSQDMDNDIKPIFEQVFKKINTQYGKYGQISMVKVDRPAWHAQLLNIHCRSFKIKTCLRELKPFLNQGEKLWQKEQLQKIAPNTMVQQKNLL